MAKFARRTEFRPIRPRKPSRRRRWFLLSGAVVLAGSGLALASGVLERLLGTAPPSPVAGSAAAASATITVTPAEAPLAAAPAPTPAPAPTLPTPLPTPPPRPTDVAATPTVTTASITVPTQVPLAADDAPAGRSATTAPISATVAPTAALAASSADELNWFSLGDSVEHRPIRAIRIGSGPIHLAVMGAIHGGWEKNTMTLVKLAYDHFSDNPDEIPDELAVYFVPATNPDGIAFGTSSDAAWNANGVDLNRNFKSYNWSQDTFGRVGGRYGPTGTKKNGGGPRPFSEPETQAVRDFILGKGIDAVLSYHSGIVSVTAKDGGGGVGEPLAKQVAAITGYGYIAKWTEYKLTGQFMDWLDEQGVKGVEIELPDQQTLDWDKNLKSMQAVMRTLAKG